MSPTTSAHRLPSRETLVVAHAATVVAGLSWALGGMGPHGDWLATVIASPAVAFLFAEARDRRRKGDRAGLRRLLRWSAPMLLLALLVVVSALNPAYRVATINQVEVLRPARPVPWLPASAYPSESLMTLASLGGLYLSGLTLAFCVHSRAALRRLLTMLAANAAVLSVLGTLQRQAGAAGPFFGAVAPANRAWFASFHYYNHWGAFAALHVATALALLFYSLSHPSKRGWIHGAGSLLGGGVLLIAATGPLSGSRSATGMCGVLVVAAFAAALPRSTKPNPPSDRTARGTRRFPFRRVVLVGALALATLGFVAWQSRDVLAPRYEQSLEQFSQLASGSEKFGRARLYADTWRMAMDHPVFGWGLGSYGLIFIGYNSAPPDVNGVKNVFIDAHSDWLQTLAELGVVGAALLLLAALLPLAECLRPARVDPVSGWLLGGCILLALYAWVEFPLACPAVVAAWWVLFFASVRTLQLAPITHDSARAPSR